MTDAMANNNPKEVRLMESNTRIAGFRSGRLIHCGIAGASITAY